MALLLPGAHWGYNKPPRGSQIDRDSPFSRALVWASILDDGSGVRASDISGYKNDASVSGSTTWGGSTIGGGAHITGGSTNLLKATSVPFTTSGPYSFMFHALLDSGFNVNVAGLFAAGPASSITSLQVLTNSSGPVLTLSIGIGASNTTGSGTTTIVAGTAYNIAVVYNAGVGTLYLNGRTEITVSATLSGAATGEIHIGNNATSAKNVAGVYSVAYAWQRALSLGEVTTLVGEPYALIQQPPLRRFFQMAYPLADAAQNLMLNTGTYAN